MWPDVQEKKRQEPHAIATIRAACTFRRKSRRQIFFSGMYGRFKFSWEEKKEKVGDNFFSMDRRLRFLGKKK
jgi:hypothetical protein